MVSGAPVGAVNCHGSVVEIAGHGLIFLGPSGVGKSRLAFLALAAARRGGLPARLVADDQVLLTAADGAIIAHRPDAIAGLIELRGTGIARLPSLSRTRLVRAVQVAPLAEMPRLPPENAEIALLPGHSLPLRFIDGAHPDPLAVLIALGDLGAVSLF